MSTLLGNVVKVIHDWGEITGVLKRLDDIGVTVHDEQQQADVFVPIRRVKQIVDQGRRGG